MSASLIRKRSKSIFIGRRYSETLAAVAANFAAPRQRAGLEPRLFCYSSTVRDLLNAISGVAVLLIAVVATIMTIAPPSDAFKRTWVLVTCLLAVVAILGLIGGQYLDRQEKRDADKTLGERRATLGALITEGQELVQQLGRGTELPAGVADEWAKRSEQFLTTLGPGYVSRFRSDAGLMSGTSLAGNPQRSNLWRIISARVMRLNEIAAELR